MSKITLFNNLYRKVTKKSSDNQTNNIKTHNSRFNSKIHPNGMRWINEEDAKNDFLTN